MKSFNIGIMQGRLFPESFKKYNIFPKKWQKEFKILKYIDLNYIELLFNNNNKDSLLDVKVLNNLKRNSINKLYSINLNYFTKNSYYKKPVEGKKAIIRALKISEYLELKIILIPCIESNEMSDEDFIKFVEIVKKLNKRKIKISFEVNKIKFKVKYLKILNKNYGFCFDSGNLSEEDKNCYLYLKKYKDIINHIHIKDKNKYSKTKKKYTNCLLGNGIVNFKKIFIELNKYSHNLNSLTMETFYGSNPILNAKKNLNFLKNYIK